LVIGQASVPDACRSTDDWSRRALRNQELQQSVAALEPPEPLADRCAERLVVANGDLVSSGDLADEHGEEGPVRRVAGSETHGDRNPWREILSRVLLLRYSISKENEVAWRPRTERPEGTMTKRRKKIPSLAVRVVVGLLIAGYQHFLLDAETPDDGDLVLPCTEIPQGENGFDLVVVDGSELADYSNGRTFRCRGSALPKD